METLVVVIVLGILASIAIPVFLAQREQAQDAAAKSVVRNAATTVVMYRTQEGHYPLGDGAAVTDMRGIHPTINWAESQNIPVPLTSASMIGAVPFEQIGSGGVVFGTRSASGECFY